jgi:hypothetical protein
MRRGRRIDLERVSVRGLGQPPPPDLGPRIEAELGRAVAAGPDPRAAVVRALGKALGAPLRERGGR